MQKYLYETFRKSYSSQNEMLETLSYDTSEFLQSVLLELGIKTEPEKVAFPAITVQYTEYANDSLIDIADKLLDRIFQLADKIYQFIKLNNIYGCAYDKEIKTLKIPNENNESNWQEVILKCISACDRVLKKKYVIEIFDDGSTELTAMLKVIWDAVFVFLSAPMKKGNTSTHSTMTKLPKKYLLKYVVNNSCQSLQTNSGTLQQLLKQMIF